MSVDPTEPARRAVLQAAAGMVIGGIAASSAAPASAAIPVAPPSNPGEFDFLSGNWSINHRRLKAPNEWDVFQGEATCWSILGGVASIEELRIPARNFSGMGLRLLDVKERRWADFWVNSKSGVLTPPPTWGGFINGEGVFISEDVDNESKPIHVRGIWDRITPKSCRWRQGISKDAGKTWEDNWLMDWTRV